MGPEERCGVFFGGVLGIEPTAPLMLGNPSTTELTPPPIPRDEWV